MSNVAESQIVTNTAISNTKVESPLEKLPRSLFFSTIEFFINDVESLINSRRCSKKIFSLCMEGLHIHLGRIKILTLQHLSFIRLLPQNDTNINPLFPFVPNLTHLRIGFLDIVYSNVVYSKVFLGLNQNCKNLKRVDLRGPLIPKALDFILPNIPPDISSFEIAGKTGLLGDHILKEIGERFLNLEHLYLEFDRDPVSSFRMALLLTKCVKLKVLHMRNFNELNHQIADYLSRCKDITHLDLYGTSIGARGIQKIGENCLKLTILDIRGNKIDDEALQAICTNCRELSTIKLNTCTPYQFLMFVNCTHLTKLEILISDIVDEDLKYILQKCKKLQYVIIMKNKIIDKNIIIKQFQKIKFYI